MIQSIFNNFIRRFLDLLKKLRLPAPLISKFFDIYHKYIIKHLTNILNLAYELTKSDTNDKNKSIIHENNIIWIFWWQGKENMPEIVRACIRSVYKCLKNHKIVFISKYNIKQYAKLPTYIYYKLHKGHITLTNFSDILEFNLLKYYGGLWIDATVYFISNAFPNKFSMLYTARGGYPKYRDNISLGRWTGFLFGGASDQKLFIFMNYVFKLYWKNNNYLIDYFLIDYALYYAYVHDISGFKKYSKSVIIRPEIYKLSGLLNKKYNPMIYNKLINKTCFFKLTYKKKLKHKQNTFYNTCINIRRNINK